ncbi:plastocyanin [Amycolatopsis lexingtonensis]|uniref:Plastocyanin n=1 Tax=Amycolatopsis lexingtonensis TaxID=218822 RepID=A0ABR9HS22_9PSEU|nr:cupredoxin family copper-binding protein [Amycolatopsis lexingtonensis]MBE1493731.1 plastocyanin [Amycolatopsis lexingtonensis]
MRRTAALVLAGLLLFLTAPATAVAATQQVMMQGYAYSPASLTVRVGDTVTWTQHDDAPHDVVTTSAPVAFRSPRLSAGQSWSYTFRQPGTYAYYCSVHPDMRASVTVLPAATTAPPKPASTPVATKPAPARTTATTPTSGAAAASVGTTSPSVTTTAAAPAPEQPAVQQATAAASPTLDPMLLVAGLVTGIAVLCLLLLGSRRA